MTKNYVAVCDVCCKEFSTCDHDHGFTRIPVEDWLGVGTSAEAAPGDGMTIADVEKAMKKLTDLGFNSAPITPPAGLGKSGYTLPRMPRPIAFERYEILDGEEVICVMRLQVQAPGNPLGVNLNRFARSLGDIGLR